MLSVAETDALHAVTTFFSAPSPPLVYGVRPPTALLLSGPPGLGKTKAVHIAATRCGLPLQTVIPGPSVVYDLRRAFSPSGSHSSSPTRVVFLDEVDAICPSVSTTAATALLLAFLDPPPVRQPWTACRPPQRVLVVAATNRPNAVDARLRRPGRLDLEVALRPPDPSRRLDLLRALEPRAAIATLERLAADTTGFVAADLAALCKRARRIEEWRDGGVDGLQESSLRTALKGMTASVLRGAFTVEVPQCLWEEIGALDDVKKRLRMAVEWPLRHAETFRRLGMKAPRGILLHGPPGCSKTTLVRAAASESKAAFVRLSGADIYSCYLGEAERILREGFACARAAAPCILFLDELDAIVGRRGVGGEGADGNGVQERVLSTLLTEMDGVVSAEGVLVFGATNRVDLLDEALLRPGRFDDVIEVGLPDEEGRREILGIHAERLRLGDDVDLDEVARRTPGWSGAALRALCMDAGMRALRETFATGAGKECGDGMKVHSRHLLTPLS